jgi:putative endonuclease
MTTSPKAHLSRNEIGAHGEQLAVEYLHGLGLRIVARNWRCRYGELDVIAAEGADTLVFVEVKTRTGDGFGGVAEAVTPQKVRRIRRLAGLWLAGQESGWSQIRIDVIGVRLGRCRTPEVTHVRGVG